MFMNLIAFYILVLVYLSIYLLLLYNNILNIKMALLYRKHKINGCFYLKIFSLMAFYISCQHFGCVHYFSLEEGHFH